MTLSPGADPPPVFDRYRSDASVRLSVADTAFGHFDEMLGPGGVPRPGWSELVDGYGLRGDTRLRAAARRLDSAVDDHGVVYNDFDGERTVARTWRVDPVPYVVDGAEWADLEKAIAQRSMLLDLILRDLYRDQRTITSGLIPPQMVFGHPGYLRKAARVEVPGPRSLFLHAVDLGRGPDGRFEVYADRTQAPSGIGYAMIDRRLVSRTFPQLFSSCAPRPITTFAASVRLALIDYAPPGVEDPTVAVLGPGSLSETAFDQAYLASALGVPLVEGADLTVRDGAVYMRSLGRFKRVDVLLRRVDAEFTDPLDLRTDSRLGVTGLVEAISRGTVTVVNTLGSGVVENPALHTVLATLAPVLIDEDLTLESVPTFWAGDDLQRTKILAELESMVLTNFRTGEELVGAYLDDAARTEVAARIAAHGWQWVGRTLQPYSVAPSMIDDTKSSSVSGAVRAAPVSLRAFGLAQGSTYAVMPGGLGSVLADGISGAAFTAVAAKDVWVTSSEVGGHVARKSTTRSEPGDEMVPIVLGMRSRPSSGYSDVAAAASPRVLADLFWLGRYLERTEQGTRMAQVIRERYQDVQYRPWASGFGAVPQFLHAASSITGLSGHLRTEDLLDPVADGEPAADRTPTPDEVADAVSRLVRMTADRHVPGTVAFAVDRLVSTVRAVRDQMSTSTWMVLATIERAVDRLVDEIGTGAGDLSTMDAGPDLARAHHDILLGVLGFTGLQAESMVHDPAWRFMDVGRRIERISTLSDLTAALFGPPNTHDVEQLLLESYLVANESAIIYRRRNRGLYQLGAVMELLLFDEANPRSLIFGLTGMRHDFSLIGDSLRSAGAERSVEELITELRRADPADLAQPDGSRRRTDLVELMTTMRDGVAELSDLLGHTRFALPQQAQPLWGGGAL